MTSRLTAALAASALAGMALLGLAAPASAQTYDDNESAGVSDSTVTPGQPLTATSGDGSFTPGETVEYGVESTYQRLGEVKADSDGAATATFEVPENLSAGRHDVVFTSVASGKQVRVPFTVVSSAAASPGRGQLPRTGSEELVALTVAGLGLVAAGAGMVVVARRRRSELPTGIA
jgi:LPXTG-motif cell wall-anchored protein